MLQFANPLLRAEGRNREGAGLHQIARPIQGTIISPMSTPRDSSRRDASDALPADMPAANVDLPRIEKAVREILLAVGENPDREGLLKTPNRVARAYAELMAGLQDDPRRHLKTVFRERYDEVVLLRDIEFH